MRYEYTDHYKVTLEVSPSIPNADYVTLRCTRDWNDSSPRVFVALDEAPALALAILEVAGYGPFTVGATADRFFAHEAVEKLKDAVQFRKDQAEREAEDTKVKGYRLRLLESSPETANHQAWSEIDEVQRDLWRRQYRAAREFFKEDQG